MPYDADETSAWGDFLEKITELPSFQYQQKDHEGIVRPLLVKTPSDFFAKKEAVLDYLLNIREYFRVDLMRLLSVDHQILLTKKDKSRDWVASIAGKLQTLQQWLVRMTKVMSVYQEHPHKKD